MARSSTLRKKADREASLASQRSRPASHAAATALRRLRVAAHNALTHLPAARPTHVLVDLTGSYPAGRPDRPGRFGIEHLLFGPPDVSLEALASTVRSLSRASWLETVVFRLQRLHVDYATAYSLRRLIHVLRDHGKRTIAIVSRVTQAAYLVASAADEVVAPESAEIHLRGCAVSAIFMRDALANLGVHFDRVAIGEHKTALEELVRQEASAVHRGQLEAVVKALDDAYVEQVATDRRLTPEHVRAAIDRGITSARDLREADLIDRIAYEDEVIPPQTRTLRDVHRFLHLPGASGDQRIAMISLTGLIAPGKSRKLPFHARPLGSVAGAETIAACIGEARRDARTAALVFYVDSPGGSALASDLIWHEVRRTAEHKPVVAIMGGMAASGGYYALAAAHRVIATPFTLTGSIGVVMGKLVTEGLLARLGLHSELFGRGRFAHLDHPSRSLSEAERQLLLRTGQEIHARFAARVADGRRLAPDQIGPIANGAMWLGAEAVDLGLADEIGDVELGLRRAAELAGISRDASVWNVYGKMEKRAFSLPSPAFAAELEEERMLLLSSLLVSSV